MNSLGTDFDTLLARGALGALVVAAGWSVAVVVSVAVEARTRGRVRLAEHTGCPPALRCWLLGLFVIVFAGVAPAQASDTGSGPAGPGTATDTTLDGLPIPDRVSGAVRPAPDRRVSTVEVRPGDSLWRIAGRRLPSDAATSTVAATVAALYAANRHTIGPEPDLLRPGQRLDFPVPTTPLEAP